MGASHCTQGRGIDVSLKFTASKSEKCFLLFNAKQRSSKWVTIAQTLHSCSKHPINVIVFYWDKNTYLGPSRPWKPCDVLTLGPVGALRTRSPVNTSRSSRLSEFLLLGGTIAILKNVSESQWEGWQPIYEMENIYKVSKSPTSHDIPFIMVIYKSLLNPSWISVTCWIF